MGKLDNKVAIITGASSGVGYGIATAFAQEGADLGICARRESKLAGAAVEFERHGAKVLAQRCDVMIQDEIEAFVAAVADQFGRIDILVNNACTMPWQKSLEDVTLEEWEMPMKSGVYATFHFMRACFPYLKEREHSKIINISSAAGRRGIWGSGPYATAKGAVDSLSKVAAIDWAPYKLNVNSLSPFTMSEAWADFVKSLPEDEQDDPIGALKVRPPTLGYVGDAVNDIGRSAVFLASEDSDYITGHILPVDGGMIELTV